MISYAVLTIAMLVGLFLYVKRPAMYLSYSLWVCFTAAFFRRLVDWKFGYSPANIILAAPVLIVLIPVLSFLRPRKDGEGPIPPPLILALVAVAYGLCVTLLRHPSPSMLIGSTVWFGPLLIGAEVARDWRNYEKNRDIILKTCIWAAGIMGTYGVYQFIVAPPWDAFWLQNVNSNLIDPSFGDPEPYKMRVWSTINSPGIFGGVMVFILLFITVAPSKLKLPFGISGYISFLLCGVRAAWLGWAVGFALVLRRSRPIFIIRIVATLAIMAAIVIPVLETTDAAPYVTGRLNSLTNLRQDESFRERQDMYKVVIATIVGQPFGVGMNFDGTVRNFAVDSGILVMFLVLGWFGSILYLVSLLLFFLGRDKYNLKDPFSTTCRAMCYAQLAQFAGGNVFIGIGGVIFWICAGAIYAGAEWNKQQQLTPAIPADTAPIREEVMA